MEYVEIRARDGSRVWRLRYNNRALRWFERQSGLRFMNLNEADLSMDDITWLLAAGLYHEHPDITLDDADEVIDEVGFAAAFEQAMGAMRAALEVPPDEDAPSNGAASKNVSGTGTRPKSKPRGSG